MSEAGSGSDEETFVGYHGTLTVFVWELQREIKPRSGLSFEGRTQLGEGFYVTEDYDVAFEFAVNAVTVSGGAPVVLEVYARGFAALRGQDVPDQLWWGLSDNSAYLNDFDYLTAPIVGYQPIGQIKFNPRAYNALSVR